MKEELPIASGEGSLGEVHRLLAISFKLDLGEFYANETGQFAVTVYFFKSTFLIIVMISLFL